MESAGLMWQRRIVETKQYLNTARQNDSQEDARHIGALAYRALLEEVYTTPKPGLVDLATTGAHTDMDVHTFEKSAVALHPWFVRMALEGEIFQGTPRGLFQKIRTYGIAAEKEMYRATGGVNTHKGLVFTLGIFCAAAGRLKKEGKSITVRELVHMEQLMTAEILQEEILQLVSPSDAGNLNERFQTNGIKNLQTYGTAGIRGEALLGYPSVTEAALPVLQQGKKEGRDWNLVKLQVLMTLMSQMQDSNILSRTNPEVLKGVHKEAKMFLDAGGAYRKGAIQELLRMDQSFIRRNVSAGGCADILATTIFLDSLTEKEGA